MKKENKLTSLEELKRVWVNQSEWKRGRFGIVTKKGGATEGMVCIITDYERPGVVRIGYFTVEGIARNTHISVANLTPFTLESWIKYRHNNIHLIRPN